MSLFLRILSKKSKNILIRNEKMAFEIIKFILFQKFRIKSFRIIMDRNKKSEISKKNWKILKKKIQKLKKIDIDKLI